MAWMLDMDRLGALVRAKLGDRSLREVQPEVADVSVSTLSRVGRGVPPDLTTLLRLCDWLGVPPATMLVQTDGQVPVLDTPDYLATTVLTDPRLSPARTNVLATLIRAAYREGDTS